MSTSQKLYNVLGRTFTLVELQQCTAVVEHAVREMLVKLSIKDKKIRSQVYVSLLQAMKMSEKIKQIVKANIPQTGVCIFDPEWFKISECEVGELQKNEIRLWIGKLANRNLDSSGREDLRLLLTDLHAQAQFTGLVDQIFDEFQGNGISNVNEVSASNAPTLLLTPDDEKKMQQFIERKALEDGLFSIKNIDEIVAQAWKLIFDWAKDAVENPDDLKKTHSQLKLSQCSRNPILGPVALEAEKAARELKVQGRVLTDHEVYEQMIDLLKNKSIKISKKCAEEICATNPCIDHDSEETQPMKALDPSLFDPNNEETLTDPNSFIEIKEKPLKKPEELDAEAQVAGLQPLKVDAHRLNLTPAIVTNQKAQVLESEDDDIEIEIVESIVDAKSIPSAKKVVSAEKLAALEQSDATIKNLTKTLRLTRRENEENALEKEFANQVNELIPYYSQYFLYKDNKRTDLDVTQNSDASGEGEKKTKLTPTEIIEKAILDPEFLPLHQNMCKLWNQLYEQAQEYNHTSDIQEAAKQGGPVADFIADVQQVTKNMVQAVWKAFIGNQNDADLAAWESNTYAQSGLRDIYADLCSLCKQFEELYFGEQAGYDDNAYFEACEAHILKGAFEKYPLCTRFAYQIIQYKNDLCTYAAAEAINVFVYTEHLDTIVVEEGRFAPFVRLLRQHYANQKQLEVTAIAADANAQLQPLVEANSQAMNKLASDVNSLECVVSDANKKACAKLEEISALSDKYYNAGVGFLAKMKEHVVDISSVQDAERKKTLEGVVQVVNSGNKNFVGKIDRLNESQKALKDSVDDFKQTITDLVEKKTFLNRIWRVIVFLLGAVGLFSLLHKRYKKHDLSFVLGLFVFCLAIVVEVFLVAATYNYVFVPSSDAFSKVYTSLTESRIPALQTKIDHLDTSWSEQLAKWQTLYSNDVGRLLSEITQRNPDLDNLKQLLAGIQKNQESVLSEIREGNGSQLQEDKKNLEEQIQNLKAQIAELERQLSESEEEKRQFAKAKKFVDGQLDSQLTEIEKLKTALKMVREELAVVKQKLSQDFRDQPVWQTKLLESLMEQWRYQVDMLSSKNSKLLWPYNGPWIKEFLERTRLLESILNQLTNLELMQEDSPLYNLAKKIAADVSEAKNSLLNYVAEEAQHSQDLFKKMKEDCIAFNKGESNYSIQQLRVFLDNAIQIDRQRLLFYLFVESGKEVETGLDKFDPQSLISILRNAEELQNLKKNLKEVTPEYFDINGQLYYLVDRMGEFFWRPKAAKDASQDVEILYWQAEKNLPLFCRIQLTKDDPIRVVSGPKWKLPRVELQLFEKKSKSQVLFSRDKEGYLDAITFSGKEYQESIMVGILKSAKDKKYQVFFQVQRDVLFSLSIADSDQKEELKDASDQPLVTPLFRYRKIMNNGETQIILPPNYK